MSHYIVPPKVYVKTAIALGILMLMTVYAAFLNLGYMNPVVAVTIAITKATLIVLFFMNVKYSTRLTWIFVGASFFWLLILFGLLLPDYISRHWEYTGKAWGEATVAAPAVPGPPQHTP